MSGEPSLNPYAPTMLPPMPYAPPGRPVRSGWLVTICVIAIVLGGFGVCNGLWGLTAVIFQEQIQKLFGGGSPPPGFPPELQGAQQQFEQEMQKLQGRYAVLLGVGAVARVAIGLALAMGGIWCLGQKLSGRTLLLWALSAALAFEVANCVLQVALTVQMIELMNNFFQDFVDSMPNRNGPPPEFMLSLMRGLMWVGFALGMLWQLAKVVFYFGSLLYLRRPSVIDQFEPAPAT